jgi:hypothetical protein
VFTWATLLAGMTLREEHSSEMQLKAQATKASQERRAAGEALSMPRAAAHGKGPFSNAGAILSALAG